MLAALPKLTDEQQRLDDLHEYKILDTPPEAAFDELTQLASYICGTPIALLSLVDIDRQWFKSKVGLTITETPRYISFCDRVIHQAALFVVRDVLSDRQFANNPLVCGEPYIRFYAGVPLINADGFVLGTLCVLDKMPRDLSSEQIKALEILSRQAIAQLDLRLHKEASSQKEKELLKPVLSHHGVLNLSNPNTRECNEIIRRPMEIHAVPLLNHLDGTSEQLAITQEIAKRLLAEKALQESEKRFRTIVNIAREGIWVLDVQGLTTYVNQRMTEILGVTVEEMLGRSLFDFMDETARLYVEPDWERRQHSGMNEQHDVRFRSKDGSIVWTICSTNPLLGENGEFIGTIAMITDISHRVHNEDALRCYTQRLEGIHEISCAILAEQSPKEIARIAIEHLRCLIPCQQAIVMLFNFDRGEVSCFACDADRKLVFQEGTILPVEDFLPLDIADGSVRYIADITKIASPPRILKRLLATGIRCCMSVPLMVEGVAIGELNLADTHTGAIEQESGAIASEVADQLAVAIQNARLFEQVRSDRQRLQTLSGRLMEAQETERRHIAHELHDQIGQALTALKMNLQVLQRLSEPGAIAAYFKESISIVEDTLGQVRNLCLDLRPSLLDDLGLVAALRWYVDRHAQRSGLVEEFVADLSAARLPANIEIACFRIVQEALTNVVRHAQAKRVSVTLQQYDQELHLLIRDDGVGFDVAAARKRSAEGGSLGLLGMEERALLVGGQIKVASTPKLGTKIWVCFPLS